jgi:hypothetical protein
LTPVVDVEGDGELIDTGEESGDEDGIQERG